MIMGIYTRSSHKYYVDERIRFMKKTLLSSLLENRAFQVPVREFRDRAENNPFAKRKRTIVVDPEDLDDYDDDYGEADVAGMDDFVRRRETRRGLDDVSRSFTDAHSGVTRSRYDSIVRDIDDLSGGSELNKDTSSPSNFNDDQLRMKSGKDSLYLSTKDLSYKKNEFNQERDVDDIDLDVGNQFMRQLDADDENPDDEFSDLDSEMGEEEPEEDDDEFSDLDPNMEEEERYDGVIRSIKGAYLVSKKEQPDETFTEVWIYNVGDEYEDEANIRKAILSATDIDPTKNFSEDGSQEAVIKTVGNVQFLTLVGLPD